MIYCLDLSLCSGQQYQHPHFELISCRALAREGDYEMMPVCACVRVFVCHADFSKTTTATDFL